MYSAIDTMSDKLDRQLIKYKEKIQDKKQGLIGR
jgi:ribosomal subunit interface protein